MNIKKLEDGIYEVIAQSKQGQKTFLLFKNSQGLKAFSNVCPHQGGVVKCDNQAFVCPIHNWKFDKNGAGLTSKHSHLQELNVEIDKNGEIFILDSEKFAILDSQNISSKQAYNSVPPPTMRIA